MDEERLNGGCELCGEPDTGTPTITSFTDPDNWCHARCLTQTEWANQ